MQLGKPDLQLSQTNLSQTSADWDARYLASQSVWSLEPNQFVVSDLSDLPAGQMVDIAGGEGRNALWFAGRGWRVENVEFSKVALQKFQERAEQAGQKVISNHSDARFATFAFKPDLAVIAYLQLPWGELELALNNAVKQMTTGLIFGVWHARENLERGFGGPQNSLVLPTAEQLESWMQKINLTGEVKLRERVVETEAGSKLAIDVTMVASL